MIRRTAVALGGLLVLFHAWLFGSQMWEGQLADPVLALRWLVAAGLVAGLAGLRRQGASMFWGRKAVSIWLLAALLHGPSVADSSLAHESPALPEVVTALVQLAAASVAVGLGLTLLALLVRRRPTVELRRFHAVASIRPDVFHPGRFLRSAPRPPPSLHVLALV
jgi:hypothetical protein